VAGAGRVVSRAAASGSEGSCPPGKQKPEPPRDCRKQAWAGWRAMAFRAAAGTVWHQRTESAKLEANGPVGHKQVPAVVCSLDEPQDCKAYFFSKYAPFFSSKSGWQP
jgi:hypothetical protein